MTKRTATPPPPENRCRESNKAGEPCGARPLAGGDLCALHDPTRGPSVRRAGLEARTAARPEPLTTKEAAALVKLSHPSEVAGTLERIARVAAAGRIDVRTANVLVLAASNAANALKAAEEARKAEAEEREREARAAKAREEWAAREATPTGRLMKRADELERVRDAIAYAHARGMTDDQILKETQG